MNRYNGRHVATRNSVINFEFGSIQRRARRRGIGLGLRQLGGQTRLPFTQCLDARLMAGDVGLQLRFCGGELLFRFVDRIHQFEFLTLQFANLRLRRLNFVAQRLIFVVLPN